METFTAPKTGNYKLECWGSQGGVSPVQAGILPGLGGYSMGYYGMSRNNKIYVCVGNHGAYNTYSYNNNLGYRLSAGMPGGGATNITTTNRGELKTFASYKAEVLIVAGAGGSCDFESGKGITGQGGHGGGISGTSGICSYYPRNGTGASGSTGGDSYGMPGGGSVPGSFGIGGVGWNDYGAQGGSGWAGGGGSGYAGTGGGGSSYIGGVQNGKTIAGNAVMPSPDGGTETGHTGNGACNITWIP